MDRQDTHWPVHRRAILQSFCGFVGLAAMPQFALALAKNGGVGLEVRHPIFAPAQRRLVAALSERIIPATDTPGAIAAGVPDFIELMLGEWFVEAERTRFIADFTALEAFAVSRHTLPFARLSAEQQDAIIGIAMTKQLPGAADDFFERIHALVVTGYYRSELGATIERSYLPVPGDYIGDYDYAKVNQVYSY